MGYIWTSIYCSTASFILKTDDDVYVNITGLLRTVNINQAALLRSVAGICSLESRHDANPLSKSHTLPQECAFDSYPWLCNGFGYITSMQTLTHGKGIQRHTPFPS